MAYCNFRFKQQHTFGMHLNCFIKYFNQLLHDNEQFNFRADWKSDCRASVLNFSLTKTYGNLCTSMKRRYTVASIVIVGLILFLFVPFIPEWVPSISAECYPNIPHCAELQADVSLSYAITSPLSTGLVYVTESYRTPYFVFSFWGQVIYCYG